MKIILDISRYRSEIALAVLISLNNNNIFIALVVVQKLYFSFANPYFIVRITLNFLNCNRNFI